MTTKKIIKKIFKILLIIVLIFFSLYTTNKVKEQFPSVEIESRSLQLSLNENSVALTKGQNLNVTDVGQSELHYYCPKEYKNSLLGVQTLKIMDIFIREGDTLMLQSDSKSELGFVYFAGLKKDQLERLEYGLKDLKLVYYKKVDIPIHYLICFNQNELRPNSRNYLGFSATKPSFVDNQWVSFVIFLTIFGLLSQFFEQITKAFE